VTLLNCVILTRKKKIYSITVDYIALVIYNIVSGGNAQKSPAFKKIGIDSAFTNFRFLKFLVF
jgi:hypothetical protein